jgi:hypothetical protein
VKPLYSKFSNLPFLQDRVNRIMFDIRDEFWAEINRVYTSVDYNVYNTLDKRHKFRKQTILADKSLTKDEKSYGIKILNSDYDYCKIINNEGTRRICENCQYKCLAALYCENCVRNYLKENFSNWTSGNNDIDNLIQKCQMVTFAPHRVVEWIPYNNLQDVEYLLKVDILKFIKQFG